MKIVRYQIIYAILLGLLCSCGGINKVLKSKDPDYKYEVAKQCYMNGKYENASMLLNDVLASMKGTEKGDEKASGKFGSEAEQRWVSSRIFSLVIILQI